ncbi:MAG TPA: diacylglycerol kinase [Clostridiales bacterium]|nr:MAG: hypothetical protein A2Y22_03680 [Clostridiales bacterium GWD2_32_59]HAN09672.1 diacylglycerol kinase [Clostridiales bacterium]
MKYFFIMNPGSKSGKSKKKFRTIFKLLDKYNIEYSFKYTKSLDDAYNFSACANKEGYDIIVAVGGDGTINKVINGFYDSYGNRISNAKFAVIYTGTSPDFCKSYGIPLNLDKAILLLSNADSKKISIGQIKFSTGGQVTTSYFACCANIGIGAALARVAGGGIRGILGDTLGTFLSLISVLTKYKTCDYKICIDNKEHTVKNVHNTSIGRTFYIASGIKVKNELNIEDNRFYSLTVKNIRIKNLIKVISKIYSGEQINNDDNLQLEYFEKLKIYDSKAEVEFDGDAAGFLPCEIEMARDKLDLICEG